MAILSKEQYSVWHDFCFPVAKQYFNLNGYMMQLPVKCGVVEETRQSMCEVNRPLKLMVCHGYLNDLEHL